MKDNNNTTADNSSFANLSNTIQDTNEFSAVKSLHKKYNKLSGFEAILEIIRGYKYLSYAFVFLSIAVSTYTFQIDLKSAFPQISIYILIVGGLFLAVSFEAIKDTSAIALFNDKMQIIGRVVGSIFFLLALISLFYFHLKAMNQYERTTIISVINSQDTNETDKSNPKLQLAIKELASLEIDLGDKKAEKTPELIVKLTSKYPNQRRDSRIMINSIESELKVIKLNIAIQNDIILDEKIANNKDIVSNQKNISAVLLLLILIIEIFATLGIVANFITVDNASKELAKHSEVVDDYINMADEMRRVNMELSQTLGITIREQTQINQSMLKIITDDIRISSENNLNLIKELANGKNNMMKDTQKVLAKISNTNLKYLEVPKKEVETIEATPTPTPKINQHRPTTHHIIKDLYNFGEIGVGEKLTSRGQIIDETNRTAKTHYSKVMNELVLIGAIKEVKGKGYFAILDYKTTLQKQPNG